MHPSTSQSPSPTLPLLILCLVLFLVVGPWIMSSEPEEATIRARRAGRAAAFPAAALILIPVIILILFQFYGSYENSILRQTQWRLPEFRSSNSFLAIGGFLLIAIALSWMHSSVKGMLYSL